MNRWSDAAAPRAGGRHGSPWRAAGAAVVLLLAMAGVGMLGAALQNPQVVRPPQPSAEVVSGDLTTVQDGPRPESSQTTGDLPPDSTAPKPVGLSRSEPTTITIPRIGVNAQIMSLGLNPDGSVAVPPLEQAHLAGWYEAGPSPGEIGNAVIVGHVDSSKIGPAVFFHLGAMRPGDTITVERHDNRSVTFQVDAVTSYPKESFPAEDVYGPNDRAGLRVVTCGGTFDEQTRNYPNNVIVFATRVT